MLRRALCGYTSSSSPRLTAETAASAEGCFWAPACSAPLRLHVVDCCRAAAPDVPPVGVAACCGVNHSVMLISGSAERAPLADYGSAHAAPTTPARKSHFANGIEGSGRQARA